MAYFANGTEGYNFDEQDCQCKYGEKPCPIWVVQSEYNYEACNNKTASKILNYLIKDDGTCEMWKMFKDDFFKDVNQEELFDG